MKYLLTLVVAILLTGCATTDFAKRSSGLSLDMTKAEVLLVMGPARKNSARKHEGKVIEEWSYWTAKQIGLVSVDNEMMADDRVTVVFIDGIVSEWGDLMNYNRILDKSMEQQQKIMNNISYPEVKVTIDNKTKEED